MRNFLLMAIAAATITACEDGTALSPELETKSVVFTVQGDFSIATTPFTRSLVADGKEMTDIWAFDYMDGELVTMCHQTSTDDGFGQVALNMKRGTHRICFVASRGKTPAVEGNNITWEVPSDTFWQAVDMEVTASSGASRTVALDRAVTKLRLTITDAIIEGVRSLVVLPATWHTGLNVLTGEPTTAVSGHSVSMALADTYEGKTGVAAAIFGFSSDNEWTTDVSVEARAEDGTVLGFADIADVPLLRNRSTELSGPLFSGSGVMSVELTTDWSAAHEGTW